MFHYMTHKLTRRDLQMVRNWPAVNRICGLIDNLGGWRPIVVGPVVACLLVTSAWIELHAQTVSPSQVTPQTMRPPPVDGSDVLQGVPGSDKRKKAPPKAPRKSPGDKPTDSSQGPKN